MTKLGDFMVRDFLPRAFEMKTKGNAPLLRALGVLGLCEKDRPLITTPADRAKNIIDAKADGTCHFCAGRVWMSPSSWASRDTWTHIVCLACLERADREGTQ